MKRFFLTIASLISFLAITMGVIFFAEVTTNTGFSLPHAALTADISANDPFQNASATPQTSTNVASVTTGTGAEINADSQTQNTEIETVAPQTTAVQTEAQPSATPTTKTTIPTAPTETASTNDGSPATSTVATATITVTPTAPTLPPSPDLTKSSIVASENITLPYDESNFQGDAAWQTTWGNISAGWSGFMDITSGPGSTGGATYLNDSTNLSNYTMTATVDWISGKTIGLMADYDDASNYILCEYDKNENGDGATMRLAQYAGGNETFLTPSVAVPWDGSGSNLNLSIRVQGVYGACSFNGESVSNQTIGPGVSAMKTPESGGIGFTVGDPLPNASEMTVSHVSIVSE